MKNSVEIKALEPGPTIEEEWAAAQAQLGGLEEERAKLVRELATARDSHKHAAARLKTKIRAVSDTRKDERSRTSQLALVGCPTAVTNSIGMRVQRIPACSQVLPLATDFALAAHVRSIKTITRKASLQTLAASHSTCSYKTPMRPWALHTSIRVHGNFRARSVLRQQAV